MKTALIIPDCHIPYEDLKAYDLMLQVAKFVKPNEIVILGDYLDFYSVSSHSKNPELARTALAREIECGKKRVKQLERLFPNADKVYIEGNHENRLSRYIRDKAPEIYGLLELPQILELHEWKFVPYGPEQKHRILGSKLHARHEPLASSAKATATKAMCSIVYGHIHSIEEHQVVSLDGSNYRAISVGWLGNKKHSVFSYLKGHAQWALGFGVVKVLSNGNWFHQTIHIIDNSCVYGGKLFKS